MNTASPKPRFPLGRIVATPGVLSSIQCDEMMKALDRHVRGDWGDLEDEDIQENELSLKEGFRLFSSYASAAGVRSWIITEADRSATTVLLPEEY